jgi:hypothetical protein
MTLAELASFSTALSGAVVTASLIYVAIQTHQNNRNIRALIHQGSIARTTSLLTSLADPDQCTAWLEGNGRNATTEAIRARQFYIQCSIAINSMDDVYFQHRSGLLHQAQFVRGSATFRRLLVPQRSDFDRLKGVKVAPARVSDQRAVRCCGRPLVGA